MTAPLLGITTAGKSLLDATPIVYANDAYVNALIQAGAVPLLIPFAIAEADWKSLCCRLDGLLLTGGGDLDPALFNGETHPKVYGVEPARDHLEIGLTRIAVESGLPLLGICRGVQVMNVALGGTLYTHLADQFPNPLRHDYFTETPRDYLAHRVTVDDQSRLAAILGKTKLEVNSLHHQGLNRLAPSLKPTAWATDGLVEGVEIDEHPFAVGVQWHPEWLPDSPPMQALFCAFVQAAICVREAA